MADLKKELFQSKNPEKARAYQRFFKTAPGEYGEGDMFLGLTVPQTREISKKFISLSLNKIENHLKSKYHEERLAALLILVEKYNKNPEERKKIFDFYIKNSKKVNNWDLVDLTADKITGRFLFDKDKSTLHKMSKSSNLWERRIAIISTFYFIKNNKFDETLRISETLMTDKHDLIHKAVGWMLREVGKRNLKAEEDFLKRHYKKMPRTMLRYAIEKFPENKRKAYLNGKI